VDEKMINKMLLWGACPMEHDGGGIVVLYQFRRMNEINPNFKFHLAPKVWEQAAPETLPFATWHPVKTEYFGQIPDKIPQIMKKHRIPLLVTWHLPWEYFPIVDKVHKIGGKVINWQTLHWSSDVLFMSEYLHDFDWWVPPTQYAVDTLVGVGGLSRGRMTKIHHGVDLSRFYPHETLLRKELGIKDDQKMILFIGRCQKTKGIVPLMLVTRKLCDEFDCHIVFKAGIHAGVSKSKEIGYLINKMAGWDSRIHFISEWMPPEFHEELVASSDIVIIPSGHEGASLVPLESLACGKTIALSDISVHREIVGGKNGEYGLLMPVSEHTEYVNDVQSVKVPNKDMVYGTLKYLLENEDEANQMATKGLNRAREHYDLDKICRQWFRLFKELS